MIGIFDSGSGGLTVLKAIRERAPDLDIVYFGDNKNAPYGNRSREELAALTARGFEILKKNGATHFVSACNSVSASVTERLLRPLRIDSANVVEMSEPSVAAFKKKTDTKILLVATVATIQSMMYQDGFKKIGIEIETLPIPTLAGAIEGGESEEEIERIIRAAIGGADMTDFDTLFLGCTHFPLVQNIFEKILGEKKCTAVIFDPAIPVAEEALHRFGREGNASLSIITSTNSDSFRSRVELLFPNQANFMNIV